MRKLLLIALTLSGCGAQDQTSSSDGFFLVDIEAGAERALSTAEVCQQVASVNEKSEEVLIKKSSGESETYWRFRPDVENAASVQGPIFTLDLRPDCYIYVDDTKRLNIGFGP